MKLRGSKLFRSLGAVVLMLVVYLLHFFLYEGLMLSPVKKIGYVIYHSIPKNSQTPHDPSSLECRILFKYEITKKVHCVVPLSNLAEVNSLLIPAILNSKWLFNIRHIMAGEMDACPRYLSCKVFRI